MKATQNMARITLILLLLQPFANSFAQSISSYLKGHFSGSLENYAQYYMKDEKIGAVLPADRFAMNSFLKLDYNYGKFSAGIQAESYLPPILGFFPIPVPSKTKIVNKYFRYTDDKFMFQVGDFYEQFGSGLIYRSFENRQIGINNAMEGINIHVDPTDYLQMKFVYGRTRLIYDYADAISRGMDLSLKLDQIPGLLGDKAPGISLGGSYVSRFQEYTGPIDPFPSTVTAFAGRFDLTGDKFSMDAEYVTKSKDPMLLNNNSENRGKALLVNSSFTQNNFGATLTLRALSNMIFLCDRESEFGSLAPVNYIPALTKQHDYLTSNIYVYNPQGLAETGFQTDVYYQIKPGTKLGGKYGTKISANFSLYHTLADSTDLFSIGKEKLFSDANIEIKRKWSKKWETTLALQRLFYNTSVIRAASGDDVDAWVVAAGFLCKFAPKKSIRVKLEHLSTRQDDGNWAAVTSELSLSSPFTFFVSDLYNYGKTNLHYYNLGASYTKKSTRFSLSFGKQRPGLFCVGGVCRFVPAAYGFTASLTTSFAN